MAYLGTVKCGIRYKEIKAGDLIQIVNKEDKPVLFGVSGTIREIREDGSLLGTWSDDLILPDDTVRLLRKAEVVLGKKRQAVGRRNNKE